MNTNEHECLTRIPRIVANKFQFASIRGIRVQAFFSSAFIRAHSRFPVSFALTCALIGLTTRPAGALDQDLRRFVSAKESQARELAKAQTNKVPSIVWSFFDAVRVDDWETATNLGARLNQASGQVEVAGDKEPLSPGVQHVWPPVLETLGAYGQFHDWNNKWLHRFGREIIESIPKGSIYFGGTSPGRFIISALSESHRDGRPFFTITQNMLVDGMYREYLQTMYGSKIQMLTTSEVGETFDEYVADAGRRREAGQLKPGEQVEIVDGKVRVNGPFVMLEMDARLARVIFEKNPDREFFVEESFPIEWMYPHLTPHGLIFKLKREPLPELRVDVVQKDQDYWKRLGGELIGDWLTDKTTVKEICDFGEKVYLHKDLSEFKGDAAYAGNEPAQKCFCKLRSGMARLYVWRMGQAKEDDEKLRLRQAADLAYRQSLAFYPYLPEVALGYIQLLETVKRHDDALRVAELLLHHDPDNASIQYLVRQLRNMN